MGWEKNAQLEAEDKWRGKANSRGWRCSRCHQVPPFEERKIFFERGLCTWCVNVLAKTD